MTLDVEKLHPLIGAKVRGVDFRQPMSADVMEELNHIWMDNLVLVFPDQPVTDEEHVAATRAFGEPEVFHQNIIKSRKAPEIFRVSNVDDDGNLMMPQHPTMQQLGSARKWHTDSSYRQNPAMGSLLHGIEISRTGGVTCFIIMYAVYSELPPHLKEKVEGRSACHDFDKLSRIAHAKKASSEEREAMPPVWQPMVRRHPITQKKSLFISPIYNDEIEGMDNAEASDLIEELTAFAEQDRFVYRHSWTTDDMVLWDNRCTMHLVTPHDPMERRVMHRTTIVGDGPVIAA